MHFKPATLMNRLSGDPIAGICIKRTKRPLTAASFEGPSNFSRADFFSHARNNFLLVLIDKAVMSFNERFQSTITTRPASFWLPVQYSKIASKSDGDDLRIYGQNLEQLLRSQSDSSSTESDIDGAAVHHRLMT
jgi:hypothetical protein